MIIFIYSQFHKTLPKSALYMQDWARFNEWLFLVILAAFISMNNQS